MDRGTLRALIIALGITIGGLLIGMGFARARSADRFVTVKGIAEREVSADVAVWPLRLVTAGNDLGATHAELQRHIGRVRTFLEAQGIDTSQTSLQGFVVTDALANPYAAAERIASRYVIRQTVLVRSSDPQRVLAASQRVAELVNAGVVLSSGEEYGPGGPIFIFTQLNALKPEMLAESTARAREAAQQFARDAQSGLGSIRRANQGIFEILPRAPGPGMSEESQLLKTVRVVSTVEYFLE
jgi:uncharacterized protein